MNYYIDFEFAEGMFRPVSWLPTLGSINKPVWQIRIISVGITSEDNRNYYAINEEFKLRYANPWVVKNVLTKLPFRYSYHVDENIERMPDRFGNKFSFYKHRNTSYKSLKQIAADVLEFCDGHSPVFYAYYADYDWICLCSLFENMINLPQGFPMYCRDLKQLLDEAAEDIVERKIVGFDAFNEAVNFIKGYKGYPKQDAESEHIAIEDAKHDKALHQFLIHFKRLIAK